MKYRTGKHFVWCSEHYDPTTAPAGSAAAAIAPSSSPKGIYDILHGDCAREDTHSTLIKGYRKTFQRLAKAWLADGSLSKDQYDEVVATVKSQSWRIWRPVLFVIPRAPVDARIVMVPHRNRAAYGPELQIVDLMPHEFDLIER
ncbi:hypothetical protein WK48_23305 [Burkholderia ubonensis]|nr:hypothetical protein WK48_23305 [Burkholderia ubonensis]